MIAPAAELDDRLTDMHSRVHDLIAINATLERTIAELKARETYLVRGITEMLGAPKLLAAAVVNGQWEVVMLSGEMLRRTTRASHTDDETRYEDAWVPITPVATTRAAIRRRVA